MGRDLKERVLVVTGASAGIGAATALEAARAGMRVVLAARNRHRLEAVAERVRQEGGEAQVVPTDVAEPAQIDRLVAETRQTFGRLDAFFANAGYGHFHDGCTELAEAERQLWLVNYFGALRCIRAAVDVMRTQTGGGHILVCSSLVGRTGLPYYSTYSATKAAQFGLVASLQLELELEGIRLTGVYPGSVGTGFHRRIAGRCGRDPASENTPRWMVQSPEGVARAVVRCLRRPRAEVWPSPLTRLAAAVWTLLPSTRTFSFGVHARKARRALSEAESPQKRHDGADEVPSASQTR